MVVFIKTTRFTGQLTVHVDVSTHETVLFLDFSDDLEIAREVQGISASVQKFIQVLGDLATRDIYSLDLTV
jgi:hypothetical protein